MELSSIQKQWLLSWPWESCTGRSGVPVCPHRLVRKNMHVQLHNIIGVCFALWSLLAYTPQIVHGDLQGSTLPIEDQLYGPHVKLLDFGLAIWVTHDEQHLGGTTIVGIVGVCACLGWSCMSSWQHQTIGMSTVHAQFTHTPDMSHTWLH